MKRGGRAVARASVLPATTARGGDAHHMAETSLTLHPLLERQLRQLEASPDAAPTAEEWRTFLERVNRSYEASDRDRYLVERSLEISSTEMAELYDQLRRSSESELAAERDKLRTVIESVGDGLCVLDGDGMILFTNPEARRLLTAADSDLTGDRKSV